MSLVIAVVRADDLLDELMPYDIHVLKIAEPDVSHVLQDFARFNESGFLPARQVDLRYVSGVFWASSKIMNELSRVLPLM